MGADRGLTAALGVAKLQRRYDQLWVYYDDAHGLAWTGRNGRGAVLGQIPMNDRMVVIASMSKGAVSKGPMLMGAVFK